MTDDDIDKGENRKPIGRDRLGREVYGRDMKKWADMVKSIDEQTRPVSEKLKKMLDEFAVPVSVSSSTGLAVKVFELDPVRDIDISKDLSNLEQQAFDKSRMQLRFLKDNSSVTCAKIGLEQGRASEEQGRWVVEDVLRRRDAADAEETESHKVTFRVIVMLARIWIVNWFRSN